MPIAAALALGGVFFALLSDHPLLRTVLMGLCLATTVTALTCWARLLRRGATHASDEIALAIALSASVIVGVGAVGPSSAVVVFLFPLVYVFGLNRSRALSHSVYGVCALGYLVVAIVAAASPGAVIMVECVLCASWLHARRNRSALEEALQAVADVRVELDDRTAELARCEVPAPQGIGSFTGRTIGPYQIGELLGHGGMGEVYRAWKRGDVQPVALKVLPRGMMAHPVHVERFFREAARAGALASRHLVRVYEVGLTDEGAPYYSMDLLRGCDLAQHIERHGRLSLEETVELVGHVAAGLECAHRAGIIHRDIKPQNVFLTWEGARRCWKVLDFGISTVSGSSGTLTQGSLLGTPGYMSPEQTRSLDVDHRTDIFALGAIAYRALTGAHAFDADDLVGSLLQILHEQPLDPALLVDLPSDVPLALAIALAKDRGWRFASAGDLAAAVAAAAAQQLSPELRSHAHALLLERPWAGAHEEPPEPSATRPYVRPALALA